MAIPFRTDQSASDVATGEATKVENYNNALDDIGLAQTEFDKATGAAIAAASPDQAQAVVDTNNDLLYVCLDGVSFTKIGPVSSMMGTQWDNAGAGTDVPKYIAWPGTPTVNENMHLGAIPYDCIFKNFYVTCNVSPVSPDNFNFALKKNGAAAGVTLTVITTDNDNETSIEVSFVAGDEFTWVLASNSGPGAGQGTLSWEIVDARTG